MFHDYDKCMYYYCVCHGYDRVCTTIFIDTSVTYVFRDSDKCVYGCVFRDYDSVYIAVCSMILISVCTSVCSMTMNVCMCRIDQIKNINNVNLGRVVSYVSRRKQWRSLLVYVIGNRSLISIPGNF